MNLELKKHDFDLYKGCFKLSKFFFQIARFYDQFKYVAKNIEGLCLLSALTPNIPNLAKGMDRASFYKWKMTFGVTLTVNM